MDYEIKTHSSTYWYPICPGCGKNLIPDHQGHFNILDHIKQVSTSSSGNLRIYYTCMSDTSSYIVFRSR